ncbi:MAG: hypothetical protein GEU88_09875 [Solirubrobacterales bacterium]|nr:hypothetical protein [Solirubrobacterales bacterium]
MLADHREQVAEQGAIGVLERAGGGADRRRRGSAGELVCADAGVAAPVGGRQRVFVRAPA